jgi:hypothetical protein
MEYMVIKLGQKVKIVSQIALPPLKLQAINLLINVFHPKPNPEHLITLLLITLLPNQNDLLLIYSQDL